MATWVNIPDTSIESGKPIRAVDGLALRDNPIAIAEGDAGAPRVVKGALKQPVAGSTFTVAIAAYQEQFTNKNTFQDILGKISVMLPGVITIAADMRSSAVDNAELEITKNGSVVATLVHTTGTSTSIQTHNETVSIGDWFSFRLRSVNISNDRTAYATNIRVESGDDSLCAIGLNL